MPGGARNRANIQRITERAEDLLPTPEGQVVADVTSRESTSKSDYPAEFRGTHPIKYQGKDLTRR